MVKTNVIDFEKKQTKKSYRKYLKLIRKHTRRIAKQVKKASPFDYDALHIFVSFLRFMQEYYVKGDNVWAMEEPGHERAVKITEALAYFDLWNDYDDDHMDEFHMAADRMHCEAERTQRIKDYFAKEEAEKEKCWNRFWEIIRDEFRYWWD